MTEFAGLFTSSHLHKCNAVTMPDLTTEVTADAELLTRASVYFQSDCDWEQCNGIRNGKANTVARYHCKGRAFSRT